MRQRVFALLFATALLTLGALASTATATASVRVYVSPTAGKPTTKFVVRFRAPSATGATLHRRYELYASGARGSRCTSSTSKAIGPTSVGSHVRLTLKPTGRAGTWCAGKFRGRIVEYITTACLPLRSAINCDIVIAPQTIGRFSFTVHKASGSSTTGTGTGTGTQGAPTFAGLQSATYCALMTPTVMPAYRSYELTWSAASDPDTPSSEIVYDIYYSSTSGGENYSAAPTATTSAGATSYSLALPNAGPAFFVVRARDTAGREDSNTVQREAVANPNCSNS